MGYWLVWAIGCLDWTSNDHSGLVVIKQYCRLTCVNTTAVEAEVEAESHRVYIRISPTECITIYEANTIPLSMSFRDYHREWPNYQNGQLYVLVWLEI